MTKQLLFLTIAIFMSISTLFAASGSIIINSPSFPATITPGADVIFNVTYSSDVDGKIHFDVFLADAEGTIDWGTWKAGVSYEITAGTDITNDYVFTMPADFDSKSLPEGYSYRLALSLKDADGTDFAYNNNGTTLVTEGTTSEVVNYVSFASTPKTEVMLGETFDISVDYSIAPDDSLRLKVSIIKCSSEGAWLADAQSFSSDMTAPTEAIINKVFNVTVDPEILVSSELTNGEVYKLDVGLYTADWGYVTSYNNPISVVADPASISENIDQKTLTIFPNPAQHNLTVKGTSDGDIVNIYNMAGSLIQSYFPKSSELDINVSDMKCGIYILQTNNNTIRFIKK